MGAGTVTRKETLLLRQRQTTRQLMGVTRLTEHGAVCGRDELLFYLLRPDNLSILSPEGIRGRVRALTGLLQGMASLELLALDSREAAVEDWRASRCSMSCRSSSCRAGSGSSSSRRW